MDSEKFSVELVLTHTIETDEFGGMETLKALEFTYPTSAKAFKVFYRIQSIIKWLKLSS